MRPVFLIMKGKTRTKAQERRFLEVQDRGCVPCYVESQLRGRKHIIEPCDIHHTNGGDNHDETYGNCPWHHRGVPKNDMRAEDMKRIFGPSLAINPGAYRARYGSESQLLALQGALLLKSPEAITGEHDGQG